MFARVSVTTEPGCRVGRILAHPETSQGPGDEGGGAADKAFPAIGKVCAQNKVKLPACAADMLNAGRFRAYLPKQVDIYSVVDGHKVIQCRNGADIVGVAYRGA